MTEISLNTKPEKQLKSRKRVADHGEVFTNEREVNAMLDLVKQETERIESRFLEPACGNGNFLAEVLKRKLEVVDTRYSKSQLEWERYAIIATELIYWRIMLLSAGNAYFKYLTLAIPNTLKAIVMMIVGVL